MDDGAKRRDPDTRTWPVMALFFLQSLTAGNFVVRIPDIMFNASLNKAELAIGIACISVGSMATLPFASVLASRRGARVVKLVGFPLFVVSAVMYGLATNLAQIVVISLVVGVSIACTELGLNLRATTVERLGNKRIMGKAHGCWTVGVFVGSVIGVQLAALGIGVFGSMLAVAVVSLPLSLAIIANIREEDAEDRQGAGETHGPRAPLALLAGTGVFIAGFAIAEGAAEDWSTLYLREMLGEKEASAGYAFSLFAAAMAVTRFSGDRLSSLLGRVRLGAASAVVALLGLALIVARLGVPSVMLGFAVFGAGVAMGYPLAMSAAGAMPGDSSRNLAAITFIAVASFMVGPLAIGFVAQLTELRWGLSQLAVILGASLLCSGCLRSEGASKGPGRPAAPGP